ncbi:MAG: hypothetical protein QM687_11095 [Ferruginibacter sp.]
MINNYKTFVAVLSFLSFGIFSEAEAQQKQHPQTLQEANYVHDKMYNLIRESAAVELPADIVSQVTELNKDNPYKQKFISGQLSLLKVVYNSNLKKEDIRFFGNQVLQSSSEVYKPIHAIVKQKLKKL